MRKLTFLIALMAAILCLPQRVMAQYDHPFYFDQYSSALGTLVIGETYDANLALVNGMHLPVQWSTSDANILSVDENGILTPHQIGSVTLSAHTDGDANYKAKDAQITLSNIQYPLSVFQGGEDYVDVTPANANNIFGDGKVSYDYATHTLTFNTWTKDFTQLPNFGNVGGAMFSYMVENQPLTVQLVGTNTITCGELFSVNTLIFSGNDAAQDKLTVNSIGHAAISASNQLTIDNASLVLSETFTSLSPSQDFTDYGVFWAGKLSVINGGNFHATVTPNTDLSSCGSCLAVGIVNTSLVGNILTEHVIWSNDPANEDDINYYYKTNADDFIGCFFDDQGGAMLPYEVEISSDAPVGPTPSTPTGPSFTWSERQINLVDLSCYNEGGKEQENGLINNIITSLTQTRDKNEDYNNPSTVESCQFSYGRIEISGCGTLKFKSIAGDLTGIVITGSIWTATNLPANWTYDDVAGTLTWVGTPAEEVTLSGNLSISVNSIEYFYSPAAAPRMEEEFCDDWQWYEITGAHTAKVTGPRNLGGSINIPASVEDNGVIYYINEINEYAFYHRGQLSNALIGENVAKIGAHAFDGCTWMTEIRIESRVVESIGDEAFKDCLLLHGLQCYTSLPPVLGNNAFEGDTRLNHIDVYSWVVSNYQGTANWSNYSSKITALWSNRAIGEKFFYHNQKTTGVYEVTSASPKEVKVLPYPADVNAIYPITYESTLVIPESPLYMNYGYAVTGIAANAFKNITDIKVVSIPQSVRSIEAGAFSGCTNVENVFFLWNDPTTVTWADGNVGAEFATAASGNTKIFVPEGKLLAYQAWAPAWAGCMVESAFEDVTASQDPHDVVFYRTYYNSSKDLMLPPDVWAYVGYVENEEFKLHTIAFDGEIVPAGTAVVLRSFSPEYRLIAMKPVAEPYTGTNQLRGTDVNIPRTSVGNNGENVYVLGKEAWIGGNRQEGMGLYKYTGATLGAHKAYLIYDGSGSGSSNQQNAPVRFLFNRDEQATGFESVQEGNASCSKILRDGQLIIIKDNKEYNAQGLIIK